MKRTRCGSGGRRKIFSARFDNHVMTRGCRNTSPTGSSTYNHANAGCSAASPGTIETPSAIALQVLNAVFYGLDLGELQTYRERVNRVSADDIQRVAQQYLRPDRLTIVLVGDATVFAKQLAGVGFDQIELLAVEGHQVRLHDGIVAHP